MKIGIIMRSKLKNNKWELTSFLGDAEEKRITTIVSIDEMKEPLNLLINDLKQKGCKLVSFIDKEMGG